MKRIVLITMILLGTLMPASMPATSAPGERDALIALYNSSNGAGWTNNTGWNTSAPHCGWYGVTCDSGGNVTDLDLSGNQLTGSIPAELGSLANLGSLDLSINQLSGPIPPQLGNLSNLFVLTLYRNQLTGTIPKELGNLTNSQYLYLYNNQLSGPIPKELANLGSLEQLDLDGNPDLVCWETQAALTWAQGLSPHYSGPTVTCDTLDHLALTALYNSTNGDGWITKTGWNTSDPHCSWEGVTCDGSGIVIFLYLVANQLTGTIPPELGTLSNLQALNLNSNQISGPIPKELGSLWNLQVFYLSGNQLSGTIPKELGKLANLQALNLGGNPDLVCWETQAALEWAENRTFYDGPYTVCNFIHLPLISR